MGYNISSIVGKVDVEKIGTDSKDFIYKIRTGNLAANELRTVHDTDKPFILDYIEWSCNHLTNIRVNILAKNKEFPQGVSIVRIPATNGSQVYNTVSPANIINQYSGIWDILEFNQDNNTYKFRLNLRGLEFARGLLVTIENTGSTNQNATMILYGRELI